MKKTLLIFSVLVFFSGLLNSQTSVNIEVHPRIELLRIVYNIAIIKKQPNKELCPVPSFYQQDVANHFKKYRKHPAIKKMRKMWVGDYSFPYLGLDLNADLTIPKKPSKDFQLFFDNWAETEIRELISLIKDFSTVSNFDQFYQNHQEKYDKMLQPMVAHFDTTTWIKEVSGFFGNKPPSKITIYFDPLNNVGNKEITSENPNEMRIGIAYIQDFIKKAPPKPISFIPTNDTKRVFYHEATHSYSSKMTYDAIEKLRTKKHLFLSEDEIKNGTKDIVWLNRIDETIVRAITAYLFKLNDGEAKGTEELSYQSGYDYADEVYNLLEKYSGNRRQFPNFESFHSEIIELILSF